MESCTTFLQVADLLFVSRIILRVPNTSIGFAEIGRYTRNNIKTANQSARRTKMKEKYNHACMNVGQSVGY